MTEQISMTTDQLGNALKEAAELSRQATIEALVSSFKEDQVGRLYSAEMLVSLFEGLLNSGVKK